MVGDIGQEFEPEEADLCEDTAFIGNAAAKDDVEGRDTVGGDDKEAVPVNGVNVADLSAAEQFQTGQMGFKEQRHGGTSILWNFDALRS